MSIAKKEIKTIIDHKTGEKVSVEEYHQRGRERQEEINQFQQRYGFINKKVQEELELTDEEAYSIISIHCPEKHCKHHGREHRYSLPGSGCLLFKCNKHMIFCKTWPVKLLRGKESEN